MVHFRHKLKITDVGTGIIKLNGVFKWYQIVFNAVKKEARTFCQLYIVDVTKSLVDEKTDHRACPSKKTLSSIFYARVSTHKQQTMTILAACEVASWTATHAPPK